MVFNKSHWWMSNAVIRYQHDPLTAEMGAQNQNNRNGIRGSRHNPVDYKMYVQH